MEQPDDCLACDLLAGRKPLPGGPIHQGAEWAVEHCVGPLGVGTVVVKPVRHVVHVADLTDSEAAAMGPLLRRTAAAVQAVVDCDQVYVCLWSHASGIPGHIHFVVQPATRTDMERFGAHGPGLQMAMFHDGTLPDLVAIETVCDGLRSALATSSPAR